MQPSRIFIIGCGDVGSQVARLWRQRQTPVTALTRSESRAEELRRLGIETVIGDLDQPESLYGIPLKGALLYYFAPPPRQGQRDSRIANLLQGVDKTQLPDRVIYISTSGVYGDQGGRWVDETTPVAPSADRARRRVDAETSLLDWGVSNAIPVVILRVAGIYGPGRLPLARLERGDPVLRAEESGYSNRIHIEDLGDICVAAASAPAGAIYNVCDDEPSTMTDYFNAVADYAGLPRPPQITLEQAEQQVSPAMFEYLRESRRLSNRRLHRELGISLRYPTLEEGLKK